MNPFSLLLMSPSVQFPDPWRRSKHKKRLIVQPLLVTLLRKHLPVGAAVYLSSDCKLIAESMREQFLTPIDIAGPVSVDNEDEGGEGGDEDGGSNTAAAACSRPDDVSAVTASSGGQQCQFRLVREDEMPQQGGGGGGGGGSRENPVPSMDENAFLCKSTLLQTAQEHTTTSGSSSRDGWISFNPLVTTILTGPQFIPVVVVSDPVPCIVVSVGRAVGAGAGVRGLVAAGI